MSNLGSEEKAKDNHVQESLNEYTTNAKLLDSSFISISPDDNAINNYSQVIEAKPGKAASYAFRALMYRLKKDYDHALSDYTSAITIDQKNPDLYMQRALTYWRLNKGVEAWQDFATALDLDLSKESVIEFLEGPLHEISNILLPGKDNDGDFPEPNLLYRIFSSDFPLTTRLMELYNEIIEKYPDLPDGHLRRGIYYMSINDHENAVNDFSAYLRFNSGDVFIIFLQGVCYDKLNNRAQAIEQFQLIVQQGIIDSIKIIKSELAKYPPIQGTDFKVFFTEIGRESSIEETLSALIDLNDLQSLLGKNVKNKSLLSMAKYLDTLESNPNAVADELIEEMIGGVFNNYTGYKGSLKDVLDQDKWPVFVINAKLAIMEYIVSQVNIRDLGEVDDAIPYENGFFYRLHESALHQYSNLMNIPVYFSKQLQYQLIAVNKKKLQDENEARLEERNKVIADLSHSIKNLISTIIDPLENMNNDKKFRPEIIQNALRGANLVREIVNAMNLSFKGSLDDFFYDAAHNTGKDSIDLEALVIESLKYSVGNMFDGKYFSNFVQKYFPRREVFDEAKAEWASISQRPDQKDILAFLAKYFFTIEISMGTASQYILGNEKGSAIKLLILFQELILNAVKYSAFVEKEVRFLNIDLAVNPGTISIQVANRFRENLATKTSGIGHIIIENFSKLLQAQPVIRLTDSIYSVEIEFSNLWGEEE